MSQHAPHVASEHRKFPQRLTLNGEEDNDGLGGLLARLRTVSCLRSPSALRDCGTRLPMALFWRRRAEARGVTALAQIAPQPVGANPLTESPHAGVATTVHGFL
jgi:hypothetical protein